MEVVRTTVLNMYLSTTSSNMLAEVRVYNAFALQPLLTWTTDINVTQDDGEFVLHEPDPADFFPPYLRREYLLEDGSRTLLPTRDLTTSYDGVIFYTFRNDTVYELRAVRELFGSEKSPGLQFPS
jgi:hypothetical protein